MRALCTVLLIALVAGPAHADGVDKKQPTLSAAESEKWLAHFNELVDTVVRHKDSCPPLAAAVNGVVDRNLATLQMTWAAMKAKKALPKEVAEAMDKRGGEMVAALQKCWNDTAVKAAFARMKPPKEDKKSETAEKP